MKRSRRLKLIADEALVLNIDASNIQSRKSPECAYKIVPGYTSMLSHFKGGFIVHGEFCSSDIVPRQHNLSFIRHCEARLQQKVWLCQR